MAKIDIQNQTIELEIYEYSPDYEVQVTYKNENTSEGMVKMCTIPLIGVHSRRDCTFDQIQESIDEYLEEYDRDFEEIKSVRVIEKQTIRNEPFES